MDEDETEPGFTRARLVARVEHLKGFVPSAGCPYPSKGTRQVADDVLAVAAGSKPCGDILEFGFTHSKQFPSTLGTFRWDEVLQFMGQNGIKCHEFIEESGQRGYSIRGRFFYKEPHQLEQYNALREEQKTVPWLGENDQPTEKHLKLYRGLGKLFGYPDDAIDEFIAEMGTASSPSR